MILLKLNDTQANKITGIYEKIWAIQPQYIEDDFWIIKISRNLVKNYGILKRYIKKLLASGAISTIDMSDSSNPDVIKIREALKKEPTKIIEFEGKYIINEL